MKSKRRAKRRETTAQLDRNARLGQQAAGGVKEGRDDWAGETSAHLEKKKIHFFYASH